MEGRMFVGFYGSAALFILEQRNEENENCGVSQSITQRRKEDYENNRWKAKGK